MRKTLLLFLLLLFIPFLEVNAADYVLKNGKNKTGTYAGEAEDAYNYYKVKPSKDGFIQIFVETSDKKELVIDICNADKKLVATQIEIDHKQSVLHKVKKKQTYYLRVKGTPDVTYKIKYKMNTFDTLNYAKKYNYTFTNASFKTKKDALLLKVKASIHGNLNFMCNTDRPITAQYLNSKKKVISKNLILSKNNLSGIGVRADKVYYIRLWNPEKTKTGTTTISNMKYQIDNVAISRNTSRGSSYTLSDNVYKEALVPAGEKSTYWYKVVLKKDQKLSIYVESRMLQMSGSGLALDLYNRDGKKITSKSIKIEEESYATYKKKKYKMNYPVKSITTGKIPSDTYYIRVVTNSTKTSGSFRIKWN